MRTFLTASASAAALFVAAGAHAAVIYNGSFEAPTTAAANGSSGTYAYPNMTVDGWTYAGAGLIDGDTATPWFGGSPPQGYVGDQYAFVQSTGTLSQTFSTGHGLFRLSWLEGSRPYFGGYDGVQSYQVILDNAVLATFGPTPNGQNFMSRSLVGPVLAAGSHTLTFKGLSSSDNTVFIDRVAGVVPEPATWAMMLLGFFGLGAAIRRRRAAGLVAA